MVRATDSVSIVTNDEDILVVFWEPQYHLKVSQLFACIVQSNDLPLVESPLLNNEFLEEGDQVTDWSCSLD